MPEVILRPDLGRMVRRLKCRFTFDAAPRHPFLRVVWERELEKAKYKAMEWFVRDMEKENWTYVEKFPVRMRGPFHATPTVSRPVVHTPWHVPSRELLSAIIAGYRPDRDLEEKQRREGDYHTTLAPLHESDRWEFELQAVFTRPRLVIEIEEEEK